MDSRYVESPQNIDGLLWMGLRWWDDYCYLRLCLTSSRHITNIFRYAWKGKRTRHGNRWTNNARSRANRGKIRRSWWVNIPRVLRILQSSYSLLPTPSHHFFYFVHLPPYTKYLPIIPFTYVCTFLPTNLSTSLSGNLYFHEFINPLVHSFFFQFKYLPTYYLIICLLMHLSLSQSFNQLSIDPPILTFI